MDIGGLEVIGTGSRLLTAEDVAEVTKHIKQLENQRYEMWVRMTHMELHECPGCANVADLQEALEENTKLRELARDMYAVMVEDAANCDVTYPEQFDDRMRELGIEVSA